jgi:tight adherence protein C
MFSTAYVAYAIVAVGIFTVYMAVMHVFRSNQLSIRVKSVVDPNFAQEEEIEEPSAFLEFCEKALKILKIDASSQRDLAITLARAGITSPNATTYYLFFRYVMQPFAMLMAIKTTYETFFVDEVTPANVTTGLFVVAVYTVAGLRGTQIFIENRKAKRNQALLDAFPEMLDLMLVCIESGLGLDAALNRICKEMRTMYPPLVAELDRTRLELTMLNDRVIALQNLADRTEIIPFRTLVSSLIQTEKFGTSLVETLRVLAEEIRTTRLFAAEQKAARIPVLITIPLIICILPAFIMIIVAPPIIKVVANGGLMGASSAFTGSNPH